MSVRIPIVSEFNARGIEAAKRAFHRFESDAFTPLQRLGGQMQVVGAAMTKYVTLPLVGAGVAAVKVAMDFDSSLAKIQALVGLTANEVDSMRASVLALAGRTAQAPTALADALFVVTSAGLRGEAALEALEFAAMASAAGLGEMTDIARSVSGAVNAYGRDVLDAARATDIIVATARAGNFETSQFAGALGRVLPFAKQAQAGLEDVGGAVALLTRTNGDAAQSVTQVQALMRAFVTPTRQAVTALDGLGLSAEDVRNRIGEDGLVATLEMLDERLGGNREQLGRILSSSEAAAAAFQILDADAATLQDTFGSVANAAGMTNEAFDIVSQTAGFKMRQSWIELQKSLVAAGDILLPLVGGLASGVGTLAGAFGRLPRPAQTATVGFLAVSASIGPLLNIGGRLVSNWKDLGEKTQQLGDKVRNLSRAKQAMVGVAGVAAGAMVALAVVQSQAQKRAEDLARAQEGLTRATTEQVAEQIKAIISFGQIRGNLEEMVAGNLEVAIAMKAHAESSDEVREALAAQGITIERLEEIIRSEAEATARAEDAQRQAREEVDRASGAYEDLEEVIGDVEDALGDLTPVQRTAADAVNAARERVEAHSRALEENTRRVEASMNAARSLIDVRWRHRDAEERTAAAIWEAVAASNDSTVSSHDLEMAYRDAERAAIDQAVAAGELAQKQAEANGEALTAAEVLEIQAEELRGVAETLAPGHPLRKRLQEYVNEIALIPSEAKTKIDVDTSTAQQRLDRLLLSYAQLREQAGGQFRGVGTTGYQDPRAPGAATGATWAHGRRVVGEHGIEEVDLPAGSQVHPAWRTDELRRQPVPGRVEIGAVHVHSDVDADAFWRRMNTLLAVM